MLEHRLAAWASARSDIRAVLVIGSRARLEHPADDWSDLDTIAFVEDAAVYTQYGDWKGDLEAALNLPVWFAAFSQTGRGDPEWEYVFANGLKLDLVFLANSAPQGRGASLSEMAEYAPYRSVYERGVRILVDKSPVARPFVAPVPISRPAQDQPALDNTIANILLDLTRAAKLARRGELWRAARAINAEMQVNFLTLFEWHAGAGRQAGGLAWQYGRFLEEWADPRVLAALPDTHAENTLPGIRRAVNASLDLLAWLVPETAHRLGLRSPSAPIEQTAPWLRQLLR